MLTVLLLTISNVFMTFAWYGHLKNLADKPWYAAALISWGIALLEYLLQVPGNRIGHAGGLSLAQLKITQEVITLLVFIVFVKFYFESQPIRWNYIAGFACILLAVFFVFFFEPATTPALGH